jgi:hypothetical protein
LKEFVSDFGKSVDAGFQAPEAPRKLAGGANHRESIPVVIRPGRGGGTHKN